MDIPEQVEGLGVFDIGFERHKQREQQLQRLRTERFINKENSATKVSDIS
jgi:poly-D-alanine transfer protein DltD